MWASKTTALTSQMQRYLQIGKKVLIVNHKADTRYGHDVVSTHDGKQFPCVMTERLNDLLILSDFIEADAVFVDEAQWFEDASDFCRVAAENHGKDIVLAGLNGGFKRLAFQPISDLLPLCDSITHLKALCTICKDGTEAVFTRRKPHTINDPNIVGGSNLYDAVCRRHYLV